MDGAGTRWRLAAMMALVYGVQGAWWPLLAVHLQDLGISGRGRGWIFAALALAALSTPLGFGQAADRRLAAQRVMGLIYTLGTAILVILALGPTAHAGVLFSLFLAYWLITAPAHGLSNTVALRNLPRPAEQFGGVRLWGTIGWMAAGWLVSLVLAATGSDRAGTGTYEAFWVAAALSVTLAVFALSSLPHTPPLAVGADARAGWDAQRELLRRPGVSVYLVAALGVSLTTPFVFQVMPAYLEARGLPRPWIASALTLGQVPEIAALAALPWMLRRCGYKITLGVGIAAWLVRFASLALDPPLWLAVAGIPLHGVGIACFTIGGQVYLDSQAAADRRASAQAVQVVVTVGLGALLGNLMAGEITGWLGNRDGSVFLIPCVINAAILALFLLRFRIDEARATPGETGARASDTQLARQARRLANP